MKTFTHMIIVALAFTSVFASSQNHEEINNFLQSTPSSPSSSNPSIVMVISCFPNGWHGQSTGFFINKSGDVATMYHSVANASEVTIITDTQKSFTIKDIKKIDHEADIAILSTNVPQKFIAPVILSKHLPQAGDRIQIIGHPSRKPQSISEGIVYSLYDVSGFDSLIRFTAPIEVGSSGSPLFNKDGEVVGIAGFMLFTNPDIPLNFAMPAGRIQAL